jgi:hypothetical protein
LSARSSNCITSLTKRAWDRAFWDCEWICQPNNRRVKTALLFSTYISI